MNNLFFSSLAFTTPSWVHIVIPIIVGILCLAGGGAIGALLYRLYRTKKVGSTQQQADAIIDLAKDEAKSLKREAIQEAREETQKLKNEQERQFRERNSELSKQENRMNQKEEALDKKEELLLHKLDRIDVQQKELINQQNELNKRKQELDKSEQKIQQELERVAGLSSEEAKQILVEEMVGDARKEAASLVRKIENEAKANGEQKAREIISTAIQR